MGLACINAAPRAVDANTWRQGHCHRMHIQLTLQGIHNVLCEGKQAECRLLHQACWFG